MKFSNRTDITYEIASKQKTGDGVVMEKSVISSIPVTRINLDKDGARKIGKTAGEYITLFCDGSEQAESEALYSILSEIVPRTGKILVAGLGNENITPDALGVRTASGVVATAHFASESEFTELKMREVYVVETGVMAQTGMESAEQIKYIANGVGLDCIIAVDSLACSEIERLGKTIQITDTGIAPGSGVKNSRAELSRRTLGVPVIAIGMPTVIDLNSLAKSKSEDFCGMVTTRDIDVTIRHYAKVMSKALNRALNPSLTPDEIEKLLI